MTCVGVLYMICVGVLTKACVGVLYLTCMSALYFLRAWACCTVYDLDGRTLYDVRRCLRLLRVPYINYVSCVGVDMNVTCVVALYMHDARGRAVY